MDVCGMERSYTVVYKRYNEVIQKFSNVNAEMIPALIPSSQNDKIIFAKTEYNVKKVVRKIYADDFEINITIEVYLYEIGDMSW